MRHFYLYLLLIFYFCSPIALSQQQEATLTFKKVEVKAALPDADKYKYLYALKPGEPFDQAKHQHALALLYNELHNSGYMNAVIKDTVICDDRTEEVTVTLSINAGEHFVIDHIHVQCVLVDNGIDSTCTNIINELKTEFVNNYYEKQTVQDFEIELKRALLQAGFAHFEITVSPVINKAKNTVALMCDVRLLEKKRFLFEGNKAFTREQLINSLFDTDISTVIPPTLLAEEIRELYRKKGFLQAEVSLEETATHFVFNIHEHNQVKIACVKLTGNTTLDKKTLIDSIFAPLLKNKVYDEDMISAAIEKLEIEHIKQGYWDFKVEKRELKVLKDYEFKLILRIKTGAQRMLSRVCIQSDNKDLTHELSALALFKQYTQAIPFDTQIIHEQQTWLTQYLRDKGYLYSSITPELMPEPNGIALKWKIDLGCGLVTFGPTMIESKGLQPYVLLRELAYKKGEPFSQKKIETSVKKLKSLGIFESVSLDQYSPAQEAEKKMVLRYTTDYPFEVRTRLGYQQVSKSFTHQSGSTYCVGGTFIWKNPTGLADTFRFDGDITRFTRDIALTYELPWIFNQPIRSLIKFFSMKYEQPLFTGSRDNLYKVHNNGILADFNRCFDYGKVNSTCGYEVKKVSGLTQEIAQTIDFRPDLINRSIGYIFCEPSVTFDSLDQKREPTSGSSFYATIKAAWAPQKREASFVKIFGEYAAFIPLYKNSIIGAMRFAAGHIFAQNLNIIMPTDRFYLGGAYTLRGYEPDMVPPLNCFTENGSQKFWVPIGGKTMVNINTEIRFPIYDKLSGVIFTDIGALSHTKLSEIYGENLYGATGFGIRYGTPIGPVRFDIGWKWKKRIPEDRSYAWFLTFGHAF